MAIYSRRTLQRFLDGVAEANPRIDLAPLVKRLNRGHAQSLDTEWELIVLYALSRVGQVDHEMGLGGSSRVDVLFKGHPPTDVAFIADVKCVSDRTADEQNPIGRVMDYVRARTSKLNLKGGFDFRVPGEVGGSDRSRRMQLALPSTAQIDQALQRTVLPWLRSVARDRPQTSRLDVAEDGFRVTITYDADARYWTGGHPSYDVAYSKEGNPVHGTLKRAADQLKDSGWQGPAGVFLCDGDAALLRPGLGGPFTCSLDAVVQDVLRQQSVISFVVSAAVIDDALPFRGSSPELRLRLFHNQSARHKVDGELEAVLGGFDALPNPTATAVNAVEWLRRNSRHGRPHTAYSISHGANSMKVRVSSRLVLELLAGRMTADEFAAHLGQDADQPRRLQPFADALASGRLIQEAKVTRLRDVDDDVIEFEFGGPDPAISRLVVPTSASDQDVR